MKALLLAGILSLSFTASAEELALKKDVLNGYKQRCHSVLPEKGYSEVEVTKTCSCEVQVLDENYDQFRFIREVGMKKQMGIALTAEEQARFEGDVVKFKSKLSKCKKPS